MTLEEIKRNAPEGATHYCWFFCFVRYYKRDGNGELFKKYVGGIWIPSFINPNKPKPL